MAKAKTVRKRRPRKKSKKQNSLKRQLIKVVVGLSIILLLVIVAGIVANHYLMQSPVIASIPPSVKYQATPDSHHSKPEFEVFSKDTEHPPEKPVPSGSTSAAHPKVSIIIDDLGYDRRLAEKFIKLDAVLTFSVLPKAPFTGRLAKLAHANGHEVMLHQPMEPNEYPAVNPGPGTLLIEMSADELISLLNENIENIPYIRGINNHMGSRMTTSTPQLRQIFSVMKTKNLYFIDSRTTAETQARASARLLKIPFAERDIFIDHYQKPDFIRSQLKRLMIEADKHGRAIGIAHPHTITLEILKEMLPEIRKHVDLVPASKIVAEIS